jgi:hypothetical protein
MTFVAAQAELVDHRADPFHNLFLSSPAAPLNESPNLPRRQGWIRLGLSVMREEKIRGLPGPVNLALAADPLSGFPRRGPIHKDPFEMIGLAQILELPESQHRGPEGNLEDILGSDGPLRILRLADPDDRGASCRVKRPDEAIKRVCDSPGAFDAREKWTTYARQE